MNSWNSTTNGNNPSNSGMYIVTVELGNERYVTESQYDASDNKHRKGWYLPDYSGDRNGEYELVETMGDIMGCKPRVVAWQPMPEAYMGK